eukprot:TRINITY_DN4035_c0_g1_i2.p1 TRINITY_DN4035_c0_g1~~TRINITY_DN4035_c0_g1_i2.p1  ORF type:complete len:455 (-),score=132.79 TRINITY_DN4035_c0_g1_i2:434-1798(-)
MAEEDGAAKDEAGTKVVKVRLVGLHDSKDAYFFNLSRGNKERITIGKATSNDVVVNLSGVSSMHCAITLAEDDSVSDIVIEDRATNGTGLMLTGDSNEKRIPKEKQVPLPNGSAFVMPMKVQVRDGKSKDELRRCFMVSIEKEGEEAPSAAALRRERTRTPSRSSGSDTESSSGSPRAHAGSGGDAIAFAVMQRKEADMELPPGDLGDGAPPPPPPPSGIPPASWELAAPPPPPPAPAKAPLDDDAGDLPPGDWDAPAQAAQGGAGAAGGAQRSEQSRPPLPMKLPLPLPKPPPMGVANGVGGAPPAGYAAMATPFGHMPQQQPHQEDGKEHRRERRRKRRRSPEDDKASSGGVPPPPLQPYSQTSGPVDPELLDMQRKVEKGEKIIRRARQKERRDRLDEALETYGKGVQYLIGVLQKLPKASPYANEVRSKLDSYLANAELLKERCQRASGR